MASPADRCTLGALRKTPMSVADLDLPALRGSADAASPQRMVHAWRATESRRPGIGCPVS